MANKPVNYFVAFLVLVFYLLATVGGYSSDRGSAASAHSPEAGCWSQDVFLPLALSDYINYFPGTQEVEPNNSYQEANGPLVSGVSYSGLFNDERDFFSIYVQTPGQISVNLNTSVNQNVQFQLFYQSINNRVGYDPSAPYEITYNGQPGWYYIFIYSGTSYPTPPTYNLIVTYPVPPTPTPHNPEPTPTCSPTNTPIPVTPGWYEVGAGSASGGGISNNGAQSLWPSVAVAPNGTVDVAWQDLSGGESYEIYVLQWNANSWIEVGTGSASGGGISNNQTYSVEPSIAIALDNTPYVAWVDGDPIGQIWEIYVRRWNGVFWEEVGNGSASGGGISNNSGYSSGVAIAIAPNNTPYIVWSDNSSGNYEIYVRRWNGSNWIEVGNGSASGGGISNNAGSSQNPTIAITSDNIPYVAWEDDSGGDTEIYVRSWNGSSWVEIGSGSASGGGISNNTGSSQNPTIAIAQDNNPYVAWQDGSGQTYLEIYVRRWNGGSWVQIGNGSAVGGGISNTVSNSSEKPTIGIDLNNIPYIAWQEYTYTGGNNEIYVRRWNGSNWAEVGVGSASGGGISNDPAPSLNPNIAIAPDDTPYVTWQFDVSYPSSQIYIRRWLE